MTAGGLDLTFLPSFQCVHLGPLPSSSTWNLCSGTEGFPARGEASSMMPRLLRPRSGPRSTKPACVRLELLHILQGRTISTTETNSNV